MHMADALVAPAVAGVMYACSAATAVYSVKKSELEKEPWKMPVMGVLGAFVFATQMINFTIPGTGASGHLCGGMLLTAVLGPYAAFLSMIGVLLIQCLLFADGGLLALGCNIWNMAFYGCFVGYFLIWRPIVKNGFSRAKIITASILGSVISLQLGAFSVTLETVISGITELPFSLFASTMQPIHLAIGFVEGLITAMVLLFVYEARPQMLQGMEEMPLKQGGGRCSFRKVMIIFGMIALLKGGIFSLFASSHPDGLEWSIEKITGVPEVESVEGSVYTDAEHIQETTAVLADYGFRGKDSSFGTSFSGIAGSLAVLGICLAACFGFRYLGRKKKQHEQIG